jgi:hypothetical protein
MALESVRKQLTFSKLVPWLLRIVAILVAVTFGSGFVWDNWIDVPDLTYEILPTYALESMSFAGLTVQNRGRATAHEVRISLGDLQTEIQQSEVQCAERWTWEATDTQTDTLVLSLDRMVSGSSLTVYLLTEHEARLDGVDVASEEGRGRLATNESTSQPLVALYVGVAIAVIAIGALVALRAVDIVKVRSRASESLLDYENMLLSQEGEVQRLKRELEEWRSGKRTVPPRARS